MLDQVLAAFDIRPDYDLDVMQPGQGLADLTARLLPSLADIIRRVDPALTIVQGDTTTTFCGALAAFYAGVETAHVEAGLRTFDLRAPFPEEMNRVLTTQLARLHFAPTELSREHLLREGVPERSVELTGNTGIDAALSVRDGLEQGRLTGIERDFDPRRKLIVVTAHRRENFGDGLERICDGIARLSDRDDIEIAWPVHPNPNIGPVVRRTLGHRANVHLMQPVEYVPFVDLLRRAHLILTDSGGIQEEAPSLGKPVLVLREKTERPEAVTAGTVKLVGSDPEALVREATILLENDTEYERMSHVHNPYGDGKASARIAARIAKHLGVIR